MPSQAPPCPQQYPRPLLWIWASVGWCRSGKATSSRSRSFSSSNSRCSSETVSCRSVVTCSSSCFSRCRLCSNSWGKEELSLGSKLPWGHTGPGIRNRLEVPRIRGLPSLSPYPTTPAVPVAGTAPVPCRSGGSAAAPPTQPAGPQPHPDFPAALPAPGPDCPAAGAESSAWPAGTEWE